MLAALERGAAISAPFVTFHGARAGLPERQLDCAAALAGARRYAGALARSGVRRGQCVLVLLPTGGDFAEAFLGTMLAGAVPVPLAQNLTFGGVERYLDNLASIARDSEARVLVTDARMRDALAKSDALRDLLATVITAADVAGQAPQLPSLPSISGADTAFIQYTSGTTGRPKGAVISHRALVSNAFSIAHGLSMDERTIGVSWLPLFHDMGLVGVFLTSLCQGFPIHLLSPEIFVMHPRRWLEVIAQVRGTHTAAPNFAYDFCVSRARDDWQRQDLSSLRIALDGAEPVHATTIARFMGRFGDHGLRPDVILPVYGMAECTLAVAFPQLERRQQTLRLDRSALEERGTVTPGDGAQAYTAISVGGPVAGMRLGIFDQTGRALPERALGEIRVSGPSLMDGYFHNEEATAELLADGYLRTQDLGFIDQGRLFVTGRAKELIIKGGRNIHPYDVERAAAAVAGLRLGSVAAFARGNPDTGTDDLVVVAETTERDDASVARITKEVRAEVLACLGVKVDALQLCRVGALPRTSSGKIKRNRCVELLREGPS